MFCEVFMLSYTPVPFPTFNLICNPYLKNNENESLYLVKNS